MFTVNFRYNETGWCPNVRKFDDEAEAYIWANEQTEASRADYSKCVDADIDVEFIVEFSVHEE